MEELSAIQWILIIGGMIAAIALYVKRDKVGNMFGSGKPPSDPKQPRK